MVEQRLNPPVLAGCGNLTHDGAIGRRQLPAQYLASSIASSPRMSPISDRLGRTRKLPDPIWLRQGVSG